MSPQNKCIEWPPNGTEKVPRAQVPHLHVLLTMEPNIFVHLALQLTISNNHFPFTFFHCLIGFNVKLQSFFKQFKFDISKVKEATFVRTTTCNIYEMYSWQRTILIINVGRVECLKILSPYHWQETSEIQISKIQQVTFVKEPIGKLHKDCLRTFSIVVVSLLYGPMLTRKPNKKSLK